MKTQLRITLVIALGFVSLAMALWCDEETFGAGLSGFGVAADANLVVAGVRRGSPAAVAGVRAGDRIERGSVSFEAREFLLGDRHPRDGARMTFCVVRGGSQARDVVLVARPAPPMTPRHAAFLWIGKFASVLFVTVGALLVLLQPSRMTWAFYLFCLGLHPIMQSGWQYAPPWLNYAGVCAYYVFYSLGYAGLLVFVARFPDDRAAGWRRVVQWAALPVLVLLLVPQAWDRADYFIPLPHVAAFDTLQTFVVIAAWTLAFVTLLVTLLQADHAHRPSVLWMAIGIGAGGFLGWMGVHVVMQFLPTPPWLGNIADIAPVLIPLCAAYAIVRHRSLDVGFVVNRVLVYGLLVAAGAVLFGTLDLLISRRLANTSLQIAIYLALALAAGFGVQALRVRAVRAIDRVFFRQRYEAAVTLDRIREATACEGSLRPEAAAAELAQGLHLASVALFRRAADGGYVREASFGWPDGTAWHLLPTDALAQSLNSGVRQLRLSGELSCDVAFPAASARPTIALALKRGRRIEGAVLIGPRTSGAMLDRDEARGIADLFTGVVAA